MAAFRTFFHTGLATDFVRDVYYNKKGLYYFVGKVDPWKQGTEEIILDHCDCDCPTCSNLNGLKVTREVSDTTNPSFDPNNAYANDTLIRDGIIYFKRVMSDDVSVMIKTHRWTAGEYYTEWNNLVDMTKVDKARPFYVINSEYNVYKCLNNNNDSKSTVEPKGVHYDVLKTSDNYLWKYMYTIPLVKRNKFFSNKYAPVQTALDQNFYTRGSIEDIVVIDQGSGYSSNPMTTATVDAPESGNEQDRATISLAIDKQTGSISSVEITNPGKGYNDGVQPKIVIHETKPSGTGKYEGNTSAILTGQIKDGQLVQVNILDPGINYNADIETSIVISGDGEGCTAYPHIVDGKIVEVIITNPGEGYTYVDVFANSGAPGSAIKVNPAKFQASIGGSILTNDQSIVEQTAVPGAIYTIKMLNKSGGYHQESTEVIIEGDGEGCTAHAVVENIKNEQGEPVAGAITNIVVDTYGKGYTYANVKIVDKERPSPNIIPDAAAYVILPPREGHGYNAVEELLGTTVSAFVSVRNDSAIAYLKQEYRQFGLIENIRSAFDRKVLRDTEASTVFDINVEIPSDVSGNLKPDSVVTINGIKHVVLIINDNTFSLCQMCSTYREIKPDDVMIYTDPSNKKQYRFNVIEVLKKPIVDKYSGSMLCINNNLPFYLQESRTFGIKTNISF